MIFVPGDFLINLGASEKVSSFNSNFFLLSFLALPQKGPKRSSPFNPIIPRKPKFPAIVQGHESPHFDFPLSAGPENGQASAPFKK